MKRTALLIGMLAWLHVPAYAQSPGIEGIWRQVRSNAGHCSDCRVEIRRGESSLTVASSNGWSASVQTERVEQAQAASGGGRWKPTGNANYSGKFFRLQLIHIGERLYLAMTGTGFRVEAIFERGAGDSI